MIYAFCSYRVKIKGIWWMPWRKEPMKDVANCDKPRVAEASFNPGISEWGNPSDLTSEILIIQEGHLVNWNILVTRGREIYEIP